MCFRHEPKVSGCGQTWENAWERFIPFLAFPPALTGSFHVVRLAGDALDRWAPTEPRAPRPFRRPALPGAADPAHWRWVAHRQAKPTTGSRVRRRPACRGRGDLGHLPAEDRRSYREPDRATGKRMIQTLIGTVTSGVPAALTELITSDGHGNAAPRTGPKPGTAIRSDEGEWTAECPGT